MNPRRRILRLLLIVGLVPSVAAAGLPLPSCACDVGSAEAGCSCCESDGSSGYGDPRNGCPCCKAKEAGGRSCCAPQGDSGETPSDDGPAVECRCGGTVPMPTAPAPPLVELTIDDGLPAASFAAVPLPPVVPRSAGRARSVLLPTRDLTTTLCALLI
ncbi:MAG: hypothetical protein WBC44_00910 [Planctomycetaceae bacterium]